MASQPQRQPLPFEPKGSASKATNKAAKTSSQGPTVARSPSRRTESRQGSGRSESTAIPAVVSRRMVRRMVIFSGIPTGLGLVIFVAAYWLLSRHIVDFPKAVVLLSTLGCFGLGVVGLSYGVLSASWEEETEGSRLGAAEFSVNLRRMISAWRGAREKPSD